MTPNAKIIVMVRDPIERAISNYRMLSARNKETSKRFETAIALESTRVNQQEEDAWRSKRYDWIFPELDYAYASRGHYADGIERYIKLFGRENVLLLTMESLKNNPTSTMNRVWTFLNIRSIPIKVVCANKSLGKKPEVSRNTYTCLANKYAKSNLSLVHDYGLTEALDWCGKYNKYDENRKVIWESKGTQTFDKKQQRRRKVLGAVHYESSCL